MKRRHFAPALLAIACVCSAPLSQAQDANADQVRAAFVYNFLKLVSWPDARSESPEQTLHLCLIADDPIQPALSGLLGGKQASERAISIVLIDREKLGASNDQRHNCHAVFLGESLEADYPRIMNALSGPGVLLIDEGSRFSWPKGMIRLFSEDEYIRFEVNLKAMELAQLTVDPKLIRLARFATE